MNNWKREESFYRNRGDVTMGEGEGEGEGGDHSIIRFSTELIILRDSTGDVPSVSPSSERIER